MNLFKKPFFLLVTFWILLHSSHVLATKLSLPVDLSIENGDLKNCIVTVSKGGEVVSAFPGKSVLRIKLEFNSEYVLTFSKPNYISKKIAVNTTVSTEREHQTFEPYKIGVKLFKQYEGVNIVVYNQPVAKIKFNASLDDFDYDVDYSKSILSQLRAVEEVLEVRAVEERRLIASGQLPKEGFDSNSASSERFARYPHIEGGSEVPNEAKHTSSSTYTVSTISHAVDTAFLNGGVDINTPANVNGGDDKKKLIKVAKDEDQKINLDEAKGNDPATEKLIFNVDHNSTKTINGFDNFDSKKQGTSQLNTSAIYPNILSDDGGVDENKLELNLNEDEQFISKELIVEPNRTITTIKIKDGKSGVVYRKVLYNWGGLYYFKNLSHSIPENLFELGTGEK